MKKFEKNDLFYNTIIGTPSYKVVFYNGNVNVNDQINEGNRITSSITFLEKNLNFTCSVTEEFTKSNIYLSYDISGTLSYQPTIKRNFIYKPDSAAFYEKYTEYSTLKKISALKNIFTKYNLENVNLKTEQLLYNDGVPTVKSKTVLGLPSNGGYNNCYINPKKSINLIEIPQAFYGTRIQPGTLNLKIYVTGTLVAEAADKYNDTRIIQTSSSYNSSLIGSEIGSILYDEGILILTGSSQLAAQNEYYIQPVSNTTFSGVSFSNAAILDSLKWIYFGSNKVTTTNVATNTPIVSASFELNFQGSNQVNTITMFCTADKNDFTWSNNRTFISGGQSDRLLLGQTSSITINSTTYNSTSNSLFIPSDGKYYENDKIIVKNTISSSFTNFESNYNPQVFLSEIAIYNEEGEMIGIAKLASPVRKTKDMDYTIKLKLDI